MRTHDLYGSFSEDLEAVRQAIERALSIEMIPHDSLYLGDYYIYKEVSGVVLRLQRNCEPLDGEPLELAFPNIMPFFTWIIVNDQMI